MATYETNFLISSQDGSENIELRNPSASGKLLRLLKIGVASETSFSVYEILRYDALATHESSPAPSQQDIYQWDLSDDAPVAEVWFGDDGSITFNGSVDYHHDEQLDTSDAGDDAEWIPAKYLVQDDQIIIPEGASCRFSLPANSQSDYTIKFLWEEISVDTGTFTVDPETVTTSAAQLPDVDYPKGFSLQNLDGSNPIYVGPTSGVTSSNGWRIASGEKEVFTLKNSNKLYAISTGGSVSIRIGAVL